jgi:hypothetical protein
VFRSDFQNSGSDSSLVKLSRPDELRTLGRDQPCIREGEHEAQQDRDEEEDDEEHDGRRDEDTGGTCLGAMCVAQAAAVLRGFDAC